uniref:Transcription elongation factor n=1 Tax=Elaeophora elaphi TaxID=1147741 RepID=A0A0R3S4P3_9BILA
MASCEEEVLRIGRKFERMIQGTKTMDDAMELLNALSALPVDINILTKTRIGMTINDLRKKTSDEHIAKRAKALIKEWKVLLANKTGSSKGDGKDTVAKNNSSASISSTAFNESSKHLSQSQSSQKSTSSGTANSSTPGTRKQLLPDEVRNKCATMILDALLSKELPDGTLDPEDLAIRTEKKLFEVHRGTSEKYKAALRSRVFNLRDKKNLVLRENVLIGAVTPEKFAVMTADEMASDEMKAQREKFTRQAIEEYQMAVQEGTPSDMFKCGKCGKKNCTYTQVQTRSADEPMTTFVFCRECGNRWKFC